jgi:hypothetical protein
VEGKGGDGGASEVAFACDDRTVLLVVEIADGRVLHDDPIANFLALGAHLATKIDNFISMFTSIFSYRFSATCRQTTTDLS